MSDQYEDRLNRFWNELSEHGAAAAHELDAGDAMLVRRLQSLAAASVPDVARERVWRDLLDTWQPTTERKELSTNTAITHSPTASLRPNGRTAPRPIPIDPRRQPSWLGRPILRSVAVAILVLGFVMAIDIVRDPGRDRGGAPAIQAPATPSPEASPAGTVVELTLPAEAIPHTHARFIALEHDTISPGADARWTPYAGTGPYMEYVISGSFTVRIEGDVEVLRADGTLDYEPANSDITLFQGDTLISLLQNAMETKNPGTSPAETMNWLFIDDPGDRFAGAQGQAEGGRKNDSYVIWSEFQLGDTFPDWPGAVTFRLQRLELAPDELVYAPKDGVQLPLTLDVTTESILNAGDGHYFKASNIKGDPTTTVYLLTLLTAERSGASPAATP
jgi:hypothetical protein